MKYVIYNRDEVFIFSPWINHKEFSRKQGLLLENITGAGFIRIGNDGTLHCYGKSEALSISCGEKDSEMVNRMFEIFKYNGV